MEEDIRVAHVVPPAHTHVGKRASTQVTMSASCGTIASWVEHVYALQHQVDAVMRKHLGEAASPLEVYDVPVYDNILTEEHTSKMLGHLSDMRSAGLTKAADNLELTWDQVEASVAILQDYAYYHRLPQNATLRMYAECEIESAIFDDQVRRYEAA